MVPHGELGPGESFVSEEAPADDWELLQQYADGLDRFDSIPEEPDDRFDEALEAVATIVLGESNLVVVTTGPGERHPNAKSVMFDSDYHNKSYEVIVGDNGESVWYRPTPAEQRTRFVRFDGEGGPKRALAADLADVIRMVAGGEPSWRRSVVATKD